jgi:hypothetical protein
METSIFVTDLAQQFPLRRIDSRIDRPRKGLPEGEIPTF